MRKLLLLAVLLAFSHATLAEGNRPTTPGDLQQIEQLQRRADKLSFGRLGPDNYTLCKARAWLDMALIEYHEQERTGIVQDAVEQAAQLLHRLEADPAYLGLDTPHPYASERVRDDLWAIADNLKRRGGAACIGCDLAKLEVQLVWTGHDKWEAGWSHAEAFARIAENLAYEVQVKAGKCKLAAQAAAPAAAGETIIIKKHTLATTVLFDFDLGMVTDGKQKLDTIVAQLKSWKNVESIQVTGHADRLNQTGAGEYNMKLSQRRADFVKEYLVSQGIATELVGTEAMGDTQPVVACTRQRAQKDRDALIKCLQPNRRVEIVVEGTR
ncbi:MAG TPA: OmpA family protein [Sideroxyarcus sp.]|nr:OmpA family protein [Sideroxyarcus sp.]